MAASKPLRLQIAERGATAVRVIVFSPFFCHELTQIKYIFIKILDIKNKNSV